jgi:hypothetical protein
MSESEKAPSSPAQWQIELALIDRMQKWAYTYPRKPAEAAFTAGLERQIAYMIEDAEARDKLSVTAPSASTLKNATLAELEQANEVRPTTERKDYRCGECGKVQPCSDVLCAWAGPATSSVPPTSACKVCGRTPPFPGGTRCQRLDCGLINWSKGNLSDAVERINAHREDAVHGAPRVHFDVLAFTWWPSIYERLKAPSASGRVQADEGKT